MIWLSKQKAKALAHRLLHTHDTAERTAFALALGIGIGLSPLFGLHTVIAVILAFSLRLNRVAVVAGAWANTPWTVIPIAWFGTLLGALVLGDLGTFDLPWPTATDFDSLSAFRLYMGDVGEQAGSYIKYYVIGNSILSIVAFAASYFLALPLIRRTQEHHAAALAARQHEQER